MQYQLKLSDVRISSIIILIAFFAVACASFNYGFGSDDMSLDEIYDGLILLDAEHNATFRTEMIPKRVLKLERIDPLLIDLYALYDDINSSRAKDEDLKKAKLNLVQGRIYMIESQKSLQEAVKLGKVGVLSPKFNCGNISIIKESARYYNQTAIYSGMALGNFDKVLTRYPDFRQVLGVDENKIDFYESSVTEYKQIAAKDMELIAEKCKE